MTRNTPKSEQHKKFLDAARELGTDKSEERFRDVLRKVASAPYAKHAAKGRNLHQNSDGERPRKNNVG